jgi:hypothetical protein
LRILLNFSQKSSHRLAVASDWIRHSINQTELRRKTNLPSLCIHDKHWLSLVWDLHIVNFKEVLGNTDLLPILKIEKCIARTKFKIDFLDDVSPLSSIVCDDGLSNKLLSALHLEDRQGFGRVTIALISYLVIKVIYSVEDWFGWHESCAAINDQVATWLILVSCCLESTPDLHVELVNIDWRSGVEESWSLTKL